MMITDTPPRNANRAGFLESDRIRTLDLPQNGLLVTIAKSLESAMKGGKSADVRRASTEFMAETSEFYQTAICGVRVRRERKNRIAEQSETR
jgi:hypothetical protein